jgi:hypothetical protein
MTNCTIPQNAAPGVRCVSLRPIRIPMIKGIALYRHCEPVMEPPSHAPTRLTPGFPQWQLHQPHQLDLSYNSLLSIYMVLVLREYYIPTSKFVTCSWVVPTQKFFHVEFFAEDATASECGDGQITLWRGGGAFSRLSLLTSYRWDIIT